MVQILFDYDRPLGLELVTLGDFLEEKLQNKVDLLRKKAVRPKVWEFIYPLQEDPRFTDGMNCSRNTHSYKQSYIRSAIM